MQFGKGKSRNGTRAPTAPRRALRRQVEFAIAQVTTVPVLSVRVDSANLPSAPFTLSRLSSLPPISPSQPVLSFALR